MERVRLYQGRSSSWDSILVRGLLPRIAETAKIQTCHVEVWKKACDRLDFNFADSRFFFLCFLCSSAFQRFWAFPFCRFRRFWQFLLFTGYRSTVSIESSTLLKVPSRHLLSGIYDPPSRASGRHQPRRTSMGIRPVWQAVRAARAYHERHLRRRAADRYRLRP